MLKCTVCGVERNKRFNLYCHNCLMDDEVMVDLFGCKHISMRSMGFSHLKCLDCKKIIKTDTILN